ncbi:hypothetical protein B484DRAFT_398784 [Ochromonadaceae sp. CCMP2298]|nr:hypothetical protein B484DRAFT_398784 [Ochromonadaceae sp. CCMP2298]
MSLSDFVDQYPSAQGSLQVIAALTSTATTASHEDDNFLVAPTASLPAGAVFVIPLFAETELMLQGKKKIGPNSFNLVCDIIGGASYAESMLVEGQVGLTLEAVASVLIPADWLMEKAKTAHLFSIPKPGGSAADTSGTSDPVDSPAVVRLKDLDGRLWWCMDKKSVRSRLGQVQPLTRLFSLARMNYYVPELVFNSERLEKTCITLKSTTKSPPDDHRDAGLHRFVTLQSLAVMKGGFGVPLRFQQAIHLRFSLHDHSKISIVDFADPKIATTTTFHRDRTTPLAREQLRGMMDNFQPLIDSLKDDYHLWAQFHDPYLLHRVSLMLSNFSEDINTQVTSELAPLLELPTPEAVAKLLTLYASQLVSDATTLSNGMTKNGHSDYYSLDVGQYHEMVHRPLDAPEPADGKKRNAKEAELVKDPNAEAVKKLKQGRMHCSFNLAGLLHVKDSNGTAVGCTQGESCPFLHITQLSLITQHAAQQCTRFNHKDKKMRENFKAAVAKCTTFKAAGDPKPPKKRPYQGGTEAQGKPVRGEWRPDTAVSVHAQGTGAHAAPLNPTTDGGADTAPIEVEQGSDSTSPLKPGPPVLTPEEPYEPNEEEEDAAFIPPELFCSIEQLERQMSTPWRS